MKRYREKTDIEPFDKREVKVYDSTDELKWRMRYYSPIEEGTYLVKYPNYWNSNNPVNDLNLISEEMLNKHYEEIE